MDARRAAPLLISRPSAASGDVWHEEDTLQLSDTCRDGFISQTENGCLTETKKIAHGRTIIHANECSYVTRFSPSTQHDFGESHAHHLRRGRELSLMFLAFPHVRAVTDMLGVLVLRVISRFACR